MRIRLSGLLPLLMSVACTASPSGPAEVRATAAADSLRLDAALVTLIRIGQEERVHASAGQRSTSAPSFRVMEEVRWFPDRPVLDSAALAAGALVASAPGRVRLEVAAFGLVAPLVAEVAPAPYVVEAGEERGGEVVLRGYRLDRLHTSAIHWEEGPAAVLARDSASMRIAVPPGPAGCTGGAYARLRVAGGAETETFEVRRARSGELTLASGEVRALSPAEAACLRLAPAAGAAYAVAYVDPTAIRRAQWDGREERVRETSFTVTAADRTRPGVGSALARSAAAAPAASPAPTPHPRLAVSDAETLYDHRAGPWRPGDIFTAWPAGYAAPDTAEVDAVYGGRFVLAVMRRDRGHLTPAWKAELERTLETAVAHGVPYLRRTVSATDPETTPGTGQIVLLAASISGAPAYTAGARIELRVDGRGLLHSATPEVLLHEIAHAYQWEARRRSQCGTGVGPCSFGFPRWGMEGGADFLVHEILREAHGIPFASNARLSNPASQLRGLAYEGYRAWGGFGAGYEASASFHRHLVHRLVRAGLPYDRAVRDVVAGTLEGWDAHDPAGVPTTGLTVRMRTHLGTEWTPEEAMLLWTLALAADDQTSNPALQEPTVHHSLGHPELSLPAPALRAGALAAASGEAALRHHALAGSHGFFLLTDDGVGGSFALASTAPETAWMVARIR